MVYRFGATKGMRAGVSGESDAFHLFTDFDDFFSATLFAFTKAESSTTEGELVSLDNFIGNIESKCQLSSDLQKFRSELYDRYSFDLPKDGPRRIVHIPEYVRPAIGRASARNRESHTEITVPLRGLYHGVQTRSLIFEVGHGNGIAAIMLVFEADADAVTKVFGDSISKTRQYLKEDSEGKDMFLFVDIKKLSAGVALICGEST